MTSAAFESVPFMRCPYTVKVIVGDPWPRRRLIVNGSMLEAIRVLAWVWRRLWNVTPCTNCLPSG
jgi:hypothetical protein